MSKGSFQVFTDHNTKIITSYADQGAINVKGSRKVDVEKIENRSGSSAGAGSGEFHMYLGARKRELERIESLEKEAEIENTKKQFAEKVEQNRLEAEQRTQKNAAKRKKLKEKKLMRKKQKKSTNNNNEEEEEESDDASKDNENEQ